MTFLASAGQYLATWVARAGQAYDSGTWGSGTLWSTNYNNAIASRDYWQHTVAHNDTAVWDNRYNAGYSAGDAAGYTRGYNTGYPAGAGSKTTTTQTASGWIQGGGDRAVLTAPRTGLAHCSAIAIFGNDAGGPDASFQFYRNGGLVHSGQNAAGSGSGLVATHATFNVNGGDSVSVRETGESGHTMFNGVFMMTVGSV